MNTPNETPEYITAYGRIINGIVHIKTIHEPRWTPLRTTHELDEYTRE